MIKISSLELDDVKRIRAVKIAPTAEGLTIIGGNNNQGKTSVLDGIAWALGGDKYRPSNATREGSTVTPKINITLSNGLVVERSGANSSLNEKNEPVTVAPVTSSADLDSLIIRQKGCVVK